MKITKRNVMSCLSVLVVLAMLLTFTACGGDPDKGDHEHSYTAEVVAPTCTANGYTKYTCACGDSYTDKETPAAHTMVQVDRKEPTCTEVGQTGYSVCSVCGAIEGESAEIPMIPHLYSTTYEYPTVDTAGSKTRVCKICDHTQVTTIKALSASLPSASKVLAELIGTVAATLEVAEGSELVYVTEPVEYTDENGLKGSIFFEIAEAAVESDGEVFKGHIKLKVGIASAPLTGETSAEDVVVNKENAEYFELYVYVNGEDVSVEMNGDDVFAGKVSEELYGIYGQLTGMGDYEDVLANAYLAQSLESLMPVIEKAANAIANGVPTVDPEYIEDLEELFETIDEELVIISDAPNGGKTYKVNYPALKKLLEGAEDKTLVEYVSDVYGEDTVDAILSFVENVDNKTIKEIVDSAVDFAEVSEVELNDLYTMIDLYVYFATKTAFSIEDQLVELYDSTIAEVIADLNGISDEEKDAFIKNVDDSLSAAVDSLETLTIDQLLSAIFMGAEGGFVQEWNEMFDMLGEVMVYEFTVDANGNLAAINVEAPDVSFEYTMNGDVIDAKVVIDNVEIDATVDGGVADLVIKVDGVQTSSANVTVTDGDGALTVSGAFRDNEGTDLLSFSTVMVSGTLTHADFEIKGMASSRDENAPSALVTMFAIEYDDLGENGNILKVEADKMSYTFTVGADELDFTVREGEEVLASATLASTETGMTFDLKDGENTLLNITVELDEQKTAIESASVTVNAYTEQKINNNTVLKLEEVFHATIEVIDNESGMDYLHIAFLDKTCDFGYELTEDGIKFTLDDEGEEFFVSFEAIEADGSASVDVLAEIFGESVVDAKITVSETMTEGEYIFTIDVDLDRLMVESTPDATGYVTFDGAISFKVAA